MENVKPPDYRMALSKDAIEYLSGFSETVRLRGSYQKSQHVKDCYHWCEANMGTKYKDWFMMGDSIHFKDSMRVTLFRLVWSDLIA